MSPVLINFLLFQTLWPVTIFGVVYQVFWPAVLIVLSMVLVSLSLLRKSFTINTWLLGCLLGFCVDSTLAITNSVNYQYHYGYDHLAPAWIMLLWLGFAITWNQSMSWLFKKPFYGAFFFSVLGPLSYIPAQAIGALSISNKPKMLMVASFLWGLTYFIVWYTRKNDQYVVA